MSMSLLTISPVLVPILVAVLTVAAAGRPGLQRAVSVGGALLLFACSALLLFGTLEGQVFTTRFGGWDAPFAIEFRIDSVSALMLLAAALLAVLALVYPVGAGIQGTRFGQTLVHGLLAGVGGAYATADLFNLYVWFEVMLVAALGLIVLGGQRQHLEAGLKYLVLNLFGTVVLLVAVTGLYGLTGDLNYSALAGALAHRSEDALALALVALLLVSLLVKAGAFPFLFWLPAAYPVLPVPLLALFTALMTKVGAYVVLRVSAEIFPAGSELLASMLGWLAVATMLVGVLGAVYHYDVRRILAFHSVSQMGYILLAAALGGTLGVAAALFFVIHHILVKSNLYLIGGMIARSGSFDLRRTGGLVRKEPMLAALFALSAAALVGIPPFSGFWAKLVVVREGFAHAEYAWAAVMLVTSGLTLLSMAKIWNEAFWKPHPEPVVPISGSHPRAAWFATLTLSLLALAMGILPGPMIEFLQGAAASMHQEIAGGTR